MTTESKATESLSLQDGKVDLYVGATVINSSILADRMVIEDLHGHEERVVIFEFEGKRRVVRIRQVMDIPAAPPEVSLHATIHDDLDPTPVPEEEGRKLLALYDLFTKRTY
jgi:hypothetical protein